MEDYTRAYFQYDDMTSFYLVFLPVFLCTWRNTLNFIKLAL